MLVSTEVTISAAHRLPNYSGKCRRQHGHNWKIEIMADGKVNKKTGMIIDFSILKRMVEELDHTNLNKIIKNPTAENIVQYLLTKFKRKYPNHRFGIKVWENEKSHAYGVL